MHARVATDRPVEYGTGAVPSALPIATFASSAAAEQSTRFVASSALDPALAILALPPNWAPNPAGGSSSDGPVQRAADPCSGSWIVDEIRSSSGLLSSAAMSFGFNASANAMSGGAGGVNAGPDLETIQTEVGSSFSSYFTFQFLFGVLYGSTQAASPSLTHCFTGPRFPIHRW